MKHHSRTVRLISLGCAKNLVDGEVMLGILKEKGWTLSDGEEAEVVIINTCGFIREAKEEAIEAILAMAAAKKEGKFRTLIVTGCLPQRYGKELLEEIPEVDFFLGTGEFQRIGDLLEGPRLPARQYVGRPHYLYDHRTPRISTSPPGMLYVKVSEGCSNFCSYCAIPLIRGNVRSRAMASVVQEVKGAVSRGVKEINLLAQDLTAYGRDRGRGTDLVHLLKGLVKVKGLRWIRLLYLHPARLTQELLAFIRKEEKICRYLDLPLQHVDPEVLQAMNRPPLEGEGREILRWVRKEIPGISLRTSLMVGFPGETEKKFRTLLEFVREAEFDHLGVFRYSKEEGTPAASLKGQVPERIKEERFHRIMSLQEEISRRKQESRIGSRLLVLVGRPGSSPGFPWEGRTQGQAPEVDGMVLLKRGSGAPPRPGDMVEALVTGATAYDLKGEIIRPA